MKRDVRSLIIEIERDVDDEQVKMGELGRAKRWGER